MKRLRLWVPLAAALTAGLLTSSTTLAGRAAVRHASASQTFTVNVDGVNPAANETFLGYFPRAIAVHAGDTVVFHYGGVGEPHTVTFGTLVDGAVSAYNRLSPAQLAGTPPASFRALDATLPSLFPSGPGDAVQSAANPCYLPNGLPGTSLCPLSQHVHPDFSGTYSYYNSGWLNANQRFAVHLSASTAPGIYRFMCLLHRESMSGRMTVVPAGQPVKSPSAQFQQGVRQLAAEQAKLAPAVAALRQGNPPVPGVSLPGQNPALVGSGVPGVLGQVDEYGPRQIKIPVGGTVTWWFLGDHTITFNSNSTNNDVRYIAPDGTMHLNPKALVPVGGPGEPPPKGPPASGKGVTFKVVASSSWDGSGFRSSGIFLNSFGPPVIEGYKLKFTKAGTYNYICTVHDHMKGTVIVGGG
jgi:plastocyanin